MLIETADHDDRVVPLHSYKYIAELQYQAGKIPGQSPLLLQVKKDTGHGHGKSMQATIDEKVDTFSFMFNVIDGLKWIN